MYRRFLAFPDFIIIILDDVGQCHGGLQSRNPLPSKRTAQGLLRHIAENSGGIRHNPELRKFTIRDYAAGRFSAVEVTTLSCIGLPSLVPLCLQIFNIIKNLMS